MNRRKILINILLISSIIVISGHIFADAIPLHVVWNKTPINIVLPVGYERMISFPEPVTFGYDDGVLPASKLRVQNNNGTLYLLAKQGFIPQRVEVRLNNTGKIVLLNLSSQKDVSDVPLNIVIADNKKLDNTDHSGSGNQSLDFASLTQFAVNSLYAPERLLKQPANIYRVAMHTERTVPLILDGTVLAVPKISWRTENYYITVVTLRNITSHRVQINPFGFCGNWKSASLYPFRTLMPAGTFGHGLPLDSTTAFLISDIPFADAIGTCSGKEA